MYQYFPPIVLERQTPTPVYAQIVAQVVSHIRSGRLKRGQRLPGARTLAARMQVHRKTLQTALDELAAQGWLTITARKYTCVARELPDIKIVKAAAYLPTVFPNKPNFTLRISKLTLPNANFQQSGTLLLAEGLPDIRLAPVRQLMRELRTIEKRGNLKRYFQYGSPQGIPYLRDTLAQHLRDTRSLQVQPEQVMITRGTQMGIYLSAAALVEPGDRVVVGDPGYITSTRTFERLGAQVVRVPVDDQGLDIDILEQLCRTKKIRMVYVIPHHHYPTTVTLTLERRIRLLNLATKYKFGILEDDYDYDFHYSSSPIAPIASLDNAGNVVYLGTLTKTLMPALRIGFMVAPEAVIHEAATLRRLIDFQGDSVMEAALAELYHHGVIASHIKKALRIYHERRDSFCALLNQHLGDRVVFRKPDGGLNVWVHFRKANLSKLCAQAAGEGVLLNDGTIYNTSHSRNCMRLGFSALDFEEQKRAVRVIEKCSR